MGYLMTATQPQMRINASHSVLGDTLDKKDQVSAFGKHYSLQGIICEGGGGPQISNETKNNRKSSGRDPLPARSSRAASLRR